ncbi:MAG: hypothetical protein Q9225_004829 [Loekoesia sp. 1 TL-2023]
MFILSCRLEKSNVMKLVQNAACDYNPRLSFKDDTPRVVEKMENMTGQPKGVWNQLLSRFYDSQLAKYPKHDFLPPFSTLTNDEDRERKAEFRPPGSYNVIVTPSSLAGLDEYKAGQDGEKTPVAAGSKSLKTLSANLLSPDLEANVIAFKDPDTVLLRVFEDNTKKLSSPSSPSSRFGLSSASTMTTRALRLLRLSKSNRKTIVTGLLSVITGTSCRNISFMYTEVQSHHHWLPVPVSPNNCLNGRWPPSLLYE